jgi:pimeloyl-ACP methyl ester carboxylesterase
LDDFSKHLGGNEKYILIGHDWGSVLALSYAQAYPHRLDKVVGMTVPPLNMFLEHVAEDKEQQQRSQYMQRFRTLTLDMLKTTNAAQTAGVSSYKKLTDRGDLKPGEVELFKNALASNETLSAAMNWYRANVPAFDAITDADKWPTADAKLTTPTLFIWGEEDRVIVPALVDKMKTAGPEVTVVRLPGINHWTSMEKPELATKAVIDFLAE